MKIEKRTIAVSELRVSEGKQPKIIGKIPYNSPSEDMSFVEVLKPGCFSDSLRSGKKIFSLWNHDSSKPLANTDSETLILRDSMAGLNVEILPDVNISWGKDAVESVRRGDTAGLSFGFIVEKDSRRNGTREIILADLLEVSPCVFPAYPESHITARNKGNEKMDTLKMLQKRYRELDGKYKITPETEIEERNLIESQLEEVKTAIDAIVQKEEYRVNIELGENRAAKRPFKSMGEQFIAIRNAMSPGGQTDPRLYEVRATGLQTGIDSEGGFLLQPDFSKEILTNAMDEAPLLELLNRIPLNSNSLDWPGEDETSRADGSRHGGVRGYWLAEAGEKQASAPKFRKISLKLNKCVVLVYTTDELLQDASALDAYLRKVGPEEIGFKVQDAVINGTGAGMPLGILNSACLVTVSKETGQDPDTLLWENIVSMWKRMLARSRKNAIWLINQNVEDQLYSMSLSIGTAGIPVFMPSGGASNAPYSSLFGRPIIPIEQCSTLGDKGDIMLVDPQSYILADKKDGVQTDVSIHVRFVYDESVFRFVYRVDGQPALESAITPFKGTDTLSPFVTLEARE